MLIIVDCSSNPSTWQCLVKEVHNITVIVAWGSIQLIDKSQHCHVPVVGHVVSMLRNVSPFTVLSGKKYGPYPFDVEMAQNTFVFGESHLFSTIPRGFSILQIRTFCLFTFQLTWNVACPLAAIL